MRDIRLKWSKRENNVEVSWNEGCRGTAYYILDFFNKHTQEELENRGYDLTTIKFSINKKLKQKLNQQKTENDN